MTARLRSPLCLFGFLLALSMALPAHADLILSSPPRDSREKEEEVFAPVAELLTKTIGQKVTFRYGENYVIYQNQMLKGVYDIVFDGPQFVGWRIAKLNHVPVAKFPGNLSFVLIAQKDNDKVKEPKDLAGRTICAFPPPNLATVSILSLYDNPVRQPKIVEIQNFPLAYKNVVSGRCSAGVLQAKLYGELDKEAKAAKVIYTSPQYPNQAFTVGPRVPAAAVEKVTKALLSPEGQAATEKLRDAFKAPTLVPATADEFKGLGKLLKDVWGFES